MITSIFRKTLKLSTAGSEGLDTGNVLTLMSNDTQRLVDTFQWVNTGIVAPVTAVVIIALLINLLGAYALIGVAVLLVLFPLVRSARARSRRRAKHMTSCAFGAPPRTPPPPPAPARPALSFRTAGWRASLS